MSALTANEISFAAPGNSLKALEIGAGTGKATAPFLAEGYDVTAVELGANMPEFLRERFNGYETFNVIVSEIGLPKIARLLKRGGYYRQDSWFHTKLRLKSRQDFLIRD